MGGKDVRLNYRIGDLFVFITASTDQLAVSGEGEKKNNNFKNVQKWTGRGLLLVRPFGSRL